jgi:hypothetical protein
VTGVLRKQRLDLVRADRGRLLHQLRRRPVRPVDHGDALPRLRLDPHEVVTDPGGFEVGEHRVPPAAAGEAEGDDVLAQRVQHAGDVDRLARGVVVDGGGAVDAVGGEALEDHRALVDGGCAEADDQWESGVGTGGVRSRR